MYIWKFINRYECIYPNRKEGKVNHFTVLWEKTYRGLCGGSESCNNKYRHTDVFLGLLKRVGLLVQLLTVVDALLDHLLLALWTSANGKRGNSRKLEKWTWAHGMIKSAADERTTEDGGVLQIPGS